MTPNRMTPDRMTPERARPNRLMILGAGGFLGSHICQYFHDKGDAIAAVGHAPAFPSQIHPDPVPFVPLSLPDEAIAPLIRNFAPHVLIYCAGTASVPQSFQSPYQDFKATVEACAFTLEALRVCQPSCQLIFLSSAALYGNSNHLPIDESTAVMPVSPYGYHKHLCEILIEEYSKLYGIQSAILRIFSAYGERLQRQVIHDLCQKIFDPAIDPIELHGTGQESRDFIHASDVARAIDCIIQAEAIGTYNVGTGQQTSISELVRHLTELSERPKSCQFNQRTRPGDPVNVEADITKLKHLGFTPSVTLVEGLKKYLSWFAAEWFTAEKG